VTDSISRPRPSYSHLTYHHTSEVLADKDHLTKCEVYRCPDCSSALTSSGTSGGAQTGDPGTLPIRRVEEHCPVFDTFDPIHNPGSPHDRPCLSRLSCASLGLWSTACISVAVSLRLIGKNNERYLAITDRILRDICIDKALVKGALTYNDVIHPAANGWGKDLKKRLPTAVSPALTTGIATFGLFTTVV